MAEGEGFEPPLPARVKRFSRPPVSTAHTSLRTGKSSGTSIVRRCQWVSTRNSLGRPQHRKHWREESDPRHAAGGIHLDRCHRIARSAKKRGRRQPGLAFPPPTAPTKSCSPTPTSTPSTIRCPTICTFPGPSRPPRRASTCSARSHQPDRRGGGDAAGRARAHGSEDRRGVHGRTAIRSGSACARCSTRAASANCAPSPASSATTTSTRATSATRPTSAAAR
jgi:hypothetical protein